MACEFSGVVRDAFIRRGHEAWSCDLKPSYGEHQDCHIKDDVLNVMSRSVGYKQYWDLMIAHPPCTYLCVSGLHRNKNNLERQAKTELALIFIQNLWEAPIKRICIENPVGCISTRLNLPAPQYIQPNKFGEDASKKTGLWLKNLPPLERTKYIAPRIIEYNGKRYERWGNQTDSGQNRLAPSVYRSDLRSITYQGIADAMAEQWGYL